MSLHSSMFHLCGTPSTFGRVDSSVLQAYTLAVIGVEKKNNRLRSVSSSCPEEHSSYLTAPEIIITQLPDGHQGRATRENLATSKSYTPPAHYERGPRAPLSPCANSSRFRFSKGSILYPRGFPKL